MNEDPPQSPLKQALFALQSSQNRVMELAAERQEPIAIIGLAYRLPGVVNGPDEYWPLLRDARSAIRPDNLQRWKECGAQLAICTEQDETRWGALLDRPDQFDPAFFGISPREALSMDPQQRLLLEVSWQALENAAISPDSTFRSKTGVYFGLSANDYAQLQLGAIRQDDMEPHFASGAGHSVASGRLSYILGWHGPSVSVDTACSSSLVAVQLACKALQNGDCSMALAGGVNLILSPESSIAFSRAGMLSSSGRVLSFGCGDGFVRGEGCGVVVLKRLGAARAAGDRVLGVILGSAVNHDGPGSGLTVPNGRAQAMLLRSALRSAGLAPSAVGYVEAHGTGTRLGDPIEAEALGEVFAGPREAPLRIGSVKTNLGHLEAAAGIAGLIKLVLALEHGEIPAQRPVGPLSEHVRWSELPLEVATHAQPWQPIAGRRIGGVSAFGFSGTNAHVIVEEAPALEPLWPTAYEHPAEVLALSAKTEAALGRMIDRYAAHLASHPEQRWADLCHTAGAGRSHFRHRLAIAADTAEEGLRLLRAHPRPEPAHGVDRPRLGFLFPGQLPPAFDLALFRELYAGSSVFRDGIDRCEQALQGYLEAPLSALVRNEPPRASALLEQPAYARAAEFAISCGLAALWRSWGAEPSAIIGHGAGEWAAAVARHALPLEQAVQQVAASGAPPPRAQSQPEPSPRVTFWIEMGLPSASPELPGNVARIASLRAGSGAWSALAQALADAYTAGLDIDWAAWNRDRDRRRIALPGYAFERQRHWFTPSAPAEPARSRPIAGDPAGHPLLGRRLRLAGPGTRYETLLHLRPESPPAAETSADTDPDQNLDWLGEHRIQGHALMPATAFIEILLAAGDRMPGTGEPELEDVLFSAPLPLDAPRLLQVAVEPGSANTARVRVYSTPAQTAAAEPAWTLHAEGTVLRLAPARSLAAEPAPPSLEQLRSRCLESIDAETFYATLNAHGAHFGPRFRGVLRLWRRPGEALAEIRIERLGQRLHPATLDACLQTAAAALPSHTPQNATLLPFHLNTLRFAHSAPTDDTCFVHATLLPTQNQQHPTFLLTLIPKTPTHTTHTHTTHTKPTLNLKFKTIEKNSPEVFYRLQWLHIPAHRSTAFPPLQWLILSSQNSADDFGQHLAKCLRSAGQSVATAHLGQSKPAIGLDNLFAKISGGVIYLHSPTSFPAESMTDFTSQTRTQVEELLDLVRALKRHSVSTRELYVVTHNAFSVLSPTETVNPFESIISGLAATIPTEQPHLSCTRIDVAGEMDLLTPQIVDELLGSSAEDCVAFRNGTRYVQRLESFEPLKQASTHLTYDASNGLQGLKYKATNRPSPGPLELEIEVRAAGLNFHDVLGALGMLSGGDPLGLECSGVITRLGSGISDYKVGDEVIAITSAAFADYAIAQQSLTLAKPATLSFAVSASLPIAYLTADHCLNKVAKLRAGQTILIHAASGGVGLAAVHLCKRAGVRIFATAGNEHKRQYLRSLGIEHVLDSRSIQFREQILTYTAQRGVDAVLNSLAGEFTDAGLSIVAPSGHFLDIGVTDIRNPEEVASLYPGVKYHSIDLSLDLRTNPGRIKDRLSSIFTKIQKGDLPVLPIEQFYFTHTIDAFQHMAATKHVGKVVLVKNAIRQVSETVFVCKGHSYIVTGGLRGLGLEIVKWLHGKGACKIIVVGRHRAAPEVVRLFAQFNDNGTQIDIVYGDISKHDIVARAIEAAGSGLRGIVHCAAVLDDAPLEQQTWEHFARVLKPKAEGAWLLHTLTRPVELDFFVLFSSWASIAGAPGAANYCAANSFLDALAHHRRSLGLPAISINWGAWDKVGMAARTQGSGRAGHGFRPLTPEAGIRALELALTHCNEAQVAIAEVNWQLAFSLLDKGGVPSVYTGLLVSRNSHTLPIEEVDTHHKRPGLLGTLSSLSHQDRRRILMETVAQMASKILSLPATQKIDPGQPLDELGLDSILGVELKTEISRATEMPMPVELLFDYPTVTSLTNYVLGFIPDSLPLPAHTQTASPEPRSTSVLDRIEELSDDEVDRLIRLRQ